MPTQYIVRRSAAKPAYATRGAAPVYVDSDDNQLKIIPAGSGTTEKFVPTADVQTDMGAEVVTATNVIAATESGKTFFLNSTTEFVSTLPAPALGLRFTFIVTAAPSGASYTVVTNGSANILLGHVLTSQDAGGTADSEESGGDTLSFVDSKAVVGDRADFECDGTNWFVRASSKVFDAITITTAS